MDPITWGAIFLGMQAAGMVFDYMGNERQKDFNRQQQRLNKQALDLEIAGIDANISMTRLQAEDASLQSLQELRKNLGSQMAFAAANGARGNPAAINQSVGAQGQDEKLRRLNLLGREAELNAQKQFAKLGYQQQGTAMKQQNQQLDNQFINRIFNMLPGPSTLFGMTGGRANSARSNYSQPSVARNFGMTPYRG